MLWVFFRYLFFQNILNYIHYIFRDFNQKLINYVLYSLLIIGQSGETVEQPLLLDKIIESLTNVFGCACCLGDSVSIISSLTRQFLSLLMRSWPRKQNHVCINKYYSYFKSISESSSPII
jgi:hypothetical protein